MRRNQGQQGQNQQLEQAINRLTEAMRDMSGAASAQANQQQGKQGQGQQQAQSKAQADAQRAAERLQETRDMLSALRNQQTGDQLDNLAREADRLASQQEDFDKRLRKNFGLGQGSDSGKQQQIARDMAREKQGMSEDLNRLEQAMQKASRELAESQRATSQKLRESLARMQQDELKLRMEAATQMLNRGMGQYAVMREAPVTQSLSQTRDEVRQAQAAMDKSKGGNGKGDQSTQQALAQAEKLRQEIEQLARAGQQQGQGGRQQGQPGQQGQGQNQQRGQQSAQSGQQNQQGQQSGQQGQQGQQSGQQSQQSGQQGQQSGQQGQQGQQGGQQGQGDGQQNAGNQGGGQQGGSNFSPRGGGGQVGPNGGWSGDRFYSDALRDVSRLQQQLRDNPELSRQVQDLARDLQRVGPRGNTGNAEALQNVINKVLGDAEQVELALRRKAESNSTPHVVTPQSVAPGYANAVAEYYRRLSKDK